MTDAAQTKQLGPGTRAALVLLILLMAIGSISLWLVIPIAWIWLASQMQEGSNPTLGPYLMVLFGIPISMVIVGKVLAKLNGVYTNLTGRDYRVRVQTPWLQSMRGERAPQRPRTVLDVVMVISVASALLVMAIWFFFFAQAALPGG